MNDKCQACVPAIPERMLIKTKGIVFRTIPYSETSVIADIFTEEVGLASYIISGVRKARSRVPASVLQLMTIVDMVAYHSEKSRLNRIREIKPAYFYRDIPINVIKNSLILFLAEICSKTIRERERNDAMFAFISRHLTELDQSTENIANLHLRFVIGLTDLLGFGPSGNYSVERPVFDLLGGEFVATAPDHKYYIADGGAFASIISYARGLEASVDMNRSQRSELTDQMVLYLRLHVDNMKEVNSHRILREIL